MAASDDSVVFEWLKRIGLNDAIPSFKAKGIVTPKVRIVMQTAGGQTRSTDCSGPHRLPNALNVHPQTCAGFERPYV